MTEAKETPFSRWYSKNKQVLSDRRKAKYAHDLDHRAKLKKAAQDYRERVRGAAPKSVGISMADAAEMLGISIWTLKEWRRKKYFPAPQTRQPVFSSNQISLLKYLVEFTKKNGKRRPPLIQAQFEDLLDWITANWD